MLRIFPERLSAIVDQTPLFCAAVLSQYTTAAPLFYPPAGNRKGISLIYANLHVNYMQVDPVCKEGSPLSVGLLHGRIEIITFPGV